MEYPKIQTLYDRDPDTFGVIPYKLRWAEFGLVKNWLVTEKIDGTNIRVMLDPDGSVRFAGRTDRAQMDSRLLKVLQEMFPPEKVQSAFEQDDLGLWPPTILYGEGYGEKIQKGGGKYRNGQSFRLFDVLVGDWWLNRQDVKDVAAKLEIQTVPELAIINDWLPTCSDDIADLFSIASDYGSIVSYEELGLADVQPEGIVARTDPLLFTRRGDRLMWKLKFKDFK